MDISLILARFWGLALVVLCIPFLLNKRVYASLVDKIQSEEVVFLYSFIATIIGALSVAMLSSWTVDYRGMITLLGWGSLLKGFFGLLLPKPSIVFINRFGKYWPLMFILFVLFLIIGIWLLSIGISG